MNETPIQKFDKAGSPTIDMEAKVEKVSEAMDRKLAGKISDALGLSKQAYLCVITLDWRHDAFTVASEQYATDEQGQVILEVIKAKK